MGRDYRRTEWTNLEMREIVQDYIYEKKGIRVEIMSDAEMYHRMGPFCVQQLQKLTYAFIHALEYFKQKDN